jgi:hypothetical protein
MLRLVSDRRSSRIQALAEFATHTLSHLLPGSHEMSIQLRSAEASGTLVVRTARVYFDISKEDIDLGNIAVRPPGAMSGQWIGRGPEIGPSSIRTAWTRMENSGD